MDHNDHPTHQLTPFTSEHASGLTLRNDRSQYLWGDLTEVLKERLLYFGAVEDGKQASSFGLWSLIAETQDVSLGRAEGIWL